MFSIEDKKDGRLIQLQEKEIVKTLIKVLDEDRRLEEESKKELKEEEKTNYLLIVWTHSTSF